MEHIRIVSATRHSLPDFMAKAALGRSLGYYMDPAKEFQVTGNFGYRISASIYVDNTAGLPQVYNDAIEKARTDPAILVFVHDDVYLNDYYWPYHLIEGLSQFAVVGVVGNVRRLPRQSSWCGDGVPVFLNQENLSGAIAHGTGFPSAGLNLNYFGPPKREVKMLDGLFIAARSETLHANDLQFDTRFQFHFYDVDFCRQAEIKNVRMGAWPISLVHESAGDATSQSWEMAYAAYLEKYGD